MNKGRILYIDYVKAFAIILVIMGHVNFANDSVKAWIYSFTMPLFFFCTGLVLNVREDFSLKEILKNKIHRLILPYFIWALLYTKLSVLNILMIIYGSYWTTARSGTLTSLWFLPVMFLSLMLFYLFVKTGMSKRLVYKLLLMVMAFAIGCSLPHLKIGYPWGIDVAFVSFSFLMLGNILRKYIKGLYLYFQSHTPIGLITSFLLFLLFFLSVQTYHLNNPLGGYIMMKSAQYGNPLLFALTAVCGTMMLLFFSIFIELLNRRGYKWLSFVGQNTLIVFVVHKPIIVCFKALFRYIQTPEVVMLTITTIGTLLLSSLLCILINKYAPILAGK